jgi:hypothetical protein
VKCGSELEHWNCVKMFTRSFTFTENRSGSSSSVNKYLSAKKSDEADHLPTFSYLGRGGRVRVNPVYPHRDPPPPSCWKEALGGGENRALGFSG